MIRKEKKRGIVSMAMTAVLLMSSLMLTACGTGANDGYFYMAYEISTEQPYSI